MKKSRFILMIIFVASLLGCSSPDISVYEKNQPKFLLENFFSGKLTAHGILKNRQGEVIRYFNADLLGHWQSGVGRLEETFLFDDGEEQERVWTLTPTGAGGYIAKANDVVGAGEVSMSGNALFMNYELLVPYDGDVVQINVDDRMYLVNEKTVINESVMTKFGFEVGYLTIVITKE
ncbi:DUF3833 domain-containing protein [Marinomonas sp.]